MERNSHFTTRAITPTWRLMRAIDLSVVFFWLAVVCAVLVFLGTTSYAAARKNRRLYERMQMSNAEMEAVERRNEQLEKECDALENDPVHIERLMRKHKKMTGEGEVIIEE
jgi:cell division protein FtsB